MDDITEKRIQAIIRRAIDGEPDAIAQMISLTGEDKEHASYLLAMNFLYSESSKYRGKAIDVMIFLEMSLSQILSNYFVEDNTSKASLLNSFVFDRMMLSAKFNLFKRILKTKHETVWKEYHQEVKEIGELLEFRNNLAHSMLNSSEDYIRGNSQKDRRSSVYYEERRFRTDRDCLF